jgi:hypothetical protein
MSSFDSADNESTRPPCLDDLLLICERLNQLNVSYVVVGGVAIFQYGLARLTDDLDFLVDADPVNVEKVVEALSCLPDQACRDIQPTDVQDYVVVRINDEITIDLMGSACGVGYAQAKHMIDWKEVRGVRIPFASPELLWMTKQTHREKDALDRAYLKKWFQDHGREIPGESS